LSSIILVLSNMIWPKIFLPFARIWFGVSNVLGIVMSKVILGVVFFLLVTPMGVVRKLLGKDSMQLKQWKKGTPSVFKMRDHTFTPGEIEKPY
jgi:polyferredoxin